MGITERLIISVMSACQEKWAKDKLSNINIFTPSTVFLFLCILFIIRGLQYYRYLRKLPPGPWGIPIMGSLAKFTKPFHLQMLEFSKQFGAIISVKMGSQLIVCINDIKTLKKIFSKSEFTARPKSALDCIVEGYGIITADGELWQNQRKFLHKHKFGLKFWGNVSENMESRVSHEVLDCMNALARDTNTETDKHGIDLSPYLSCSISNVICSITMSTRFKHNTERFAKFINYFDEGFRLFTLTGPMIFLPWLRHLPNIRATIDKLGANRSELLNFVGEIIEDHKVSIADHKGEDDKTPRDLVDQYLLEIKQRQEEGTLEEVFGDKDPETQMKQILIDLFSAGFETVKTTLLWTFIHMLRNPTVKAKVVAELECVVGPGRMPCMEDMDKLNYTRATIYESMRRSSAVPMGTTHSNTRPVQVDGYLIPVNSHVIPNLYAIHMDHQLWPQPENFEPGRFIHPETGKVFKPKNFLPFGTGQRMCLGDSLAEMELQLFFASMMHVFDIDQADTNTLNLPSLEGNFGATLTPSDYKVKLTPRNVEALVAENLKSKPANYLHMRTYG